VSNEVKKCDEKRSKEAERKAEGNVWAFAHPRKEINGFTFKRNNFVVFT
jgi:hypothetical protein